MTDRIGSDEIAARKRIAEEKREAELRNRRESLRARAELEEDRRRELDEAERWARIAVQQRERYQTEAEDQLRKTVRGPDALRQITDILTKPGIATARGFAGQAALVQTSRPKGTNGAVSFHFKVTSAAKGSSALIDVISGRRDTDAPTSDPDQHQDYIERRGAAENIGATEMQHYVEDSTKAERLPDGIVTSSFGNIGGGRDERRRFWRAVQDAERNASPTHVILQPSARPDIWSSVRALTGRESEIPPVLIAALETNAAVSAEITDADAIRLVEIFRAAGVTQFRQRGKKGASARPISFRLGRSGRIQLRLVIELPHELNARQRFDLARDFCSQYERQSLPYWAVIHAPNAHNDDKNYHLHINLSERPAQRISDLKTGQAMWDFECLEHFTSSSRHRRTRRPYMQRKLREISDRKWIPRERARFAQIANAHLSKAGLDKRLDPRRHEEMGVKEKARERISPEAYALERRGQETAAGLNLAPKQWAAANDSHVARAQHAAVLLVKQEIDLRQVRRRWAWRGTADTRSALQAAEEALQLSRRRIELLVERSALTDVVAKLASRARLKLAKQRNEADRAALAIFNEAKPRIAEIVRAVVSLEQGIASAAARSKEALQRALRAEQDAAADRQSRALHQSPGSKNGVVEHPDQSGAQLNALATPASMSTQTRQTFTEISDGEVVPTSQFTTVSAEGRMHPAGRSPAQTAPADAQPERAVSSKPASSLSPAATEVPPTQPRTDTSTMSDAVRAPQAADSKASSVQTASEQQAASAIPMRPDQRASGPATQDPRIPPTQRPHADTEAAANQANRSLNETIAAINKPRATTSQAPDVRSALPGLPRAGDSNPALRQAAAGGETRHISNNLPPVASPPAGQPQPDRLMLAILQRQRADSAARQNSNRSEPQRLAAGPPAAATIGASKKVLSAVEQRKADEEARSRAKEEAELEELLEERRIFEEAREQERADRATREASEELRRLVATNALLQMKSDYVLLALTPQDIATPDIIRGQLLRAALSPEHFNRAAAGPDRFGVKLQTLIDFVASPGQAHLIGRRQAETAKLLSDSVQRLSGPEAHLWRLRPLPQRQRGGPGIG